MKKTIKKAGAVFMAAILAASVPLLTVMGENSETLQQGYVYEEQVHSDSILDDSENILTYVIGLEHLLEAPLLDVDESVEMVLDAPSDLAFRSHADDFSFLPRSSQVANVMNAEYFDAAYELSMNQMRPRTGDFFATVPGFITQVGGMAQLPISLFPGEIMHVQMDVPNSASIDYDLYLFEWSNILGWVLIRASELTTFINGASGSLPEHVGVVNNNGRITDYMIVVMSFRGASSTMPFVLNIGINNTFDNHEIDSIFTPLRHTLNSSAVLNGRSLNTRADNDWLAITIPATRSYTHVNFDLRNTAPGHTLEVYTFQNGQARRVNLDANNSMAASTGTFYI